MGRKLPRRHRSPVFLLGDVRHEASPKVDGHARRGKVRLGGIDGYKARVRVPGDEGGDEGGVHEHGIGQVGGVRGRELCRFVFGEQEHTRFLYHVQQADHGGCVERCLAVAVHVGGRFLADDGRGRGGRFVSLAGGRRGGACLGGAAVRRAWPPLR